MNELKGSNISLYIDGVEVECFVDSPITTVSTKLSLETTVFYADFGTRFWIAQCLVGWYLFPVMSVYKTKPTKRQVRKFKRMVRKRYQ